jgi:NhaA family Na+:H+ antiporter
VSGSLVDVLLGDPAARYRPIGAPMTDTRPSRRTRLRTWVTAETTGGFLLLGAAALALIWANSPWRDAYAALAEFRFGPDVLHLDLTVAHWASDGLLAIFFFVVGVELKHELVAGSLRRPKEAAVPVLAAVGGMIVPAMLYLVVVLGFGDREAVHGWAIPTATDIAFALAVLAIFGRGLPRALRTFLLTLAVVDDLLAIVVIAVFYTSGVDVLMLGASVLAVALFAVLVRTRRPRWWLLVPIAIIAWGFMHASGVHATIAGVLLGFTVPARLIHGETEPRTHRFDDRVRPFSSGFALPIFAFFSAGVSLVDDGGPLAVIGQPVVLAITLGLVVGKIVGVLGMTAVLTRLTPLRLPDSIGMRDLLPVGFLTGIGFTVALLIAELSFPDTEHTAGAKVAILGATLLAAVLAAGTLRWDARRARQRDMNEDGVDDVESGRIGDEGVIGGSESGT